MDIIAENVVELIVGYTLAPIARQVGYLIFYERNFENLKHQVAELKKVKEAIGLEVDAERRNARQIYDSVHHWLDKMDEIIEAAEQFSDDPRHSNVGCWPLHDLKSQHQLSRKASEMAENIAEVIRVKDYVGPLAFLPNLKGEKLESREKMKEDILAALKDPNLSRIGVYGLGGVGKTTLVEEIGKQVKDDKLFDEVVMANISQDADLKRIQGEIADLLGLHFEETTIAGRAKRLSQRIKNEKSILILLDDIWAMLELDKLGIPMNDHKGCKLLLTSRNLDILQTMGTQKDFLIGVLNEDEAWSLFEDIVGDVVEDANLREVAIQVAQKCFGLIGLIVMVAKALKNIDDIDDWKYALNQLNTVDKGETKETIYSSLEFSYNHLESDEMKALFLLLGLLRSKNDVQYLLKCVVGLGLFKQIYTLEVARLKLYRLMSSLKASCLLLENNSNETFKMHDIVNDVAVSIASRDQHACRIGMGDELWSSEGILQRCTQIILEWCGIPKLPERLECPNMKLFCLYNSNESLSVPDTFFEGMTNLKVLDLTKMHLPSLPQSFHSLIDLQTLCLDQCVMGDMTNIGALVNLQILSLSASSMIMLPSELGQLKNLRMLDITDARIEIFPSNIISKLTKLEELYLGNTCIKWDQDDSFGENKNASLEELRHLKNLTALEIQISDARLLPKDISFDRLERYKVVIGDEWKWPDNEKSSRLLKLKLDTDIHLEQGIKMLIESVEDLYVSGISTVLFGLNWEGFPLLKHFHIQNNGEIQHIVNTMEWNQSHVLFPRLETLVLHNLDNLVKICYGQVRDNSLARLKVVKIKSCDQLEYLFSISIVKVFSQLVEIEVSECNSMKKIVFVESADTEIFGGLLPELRQLCLRNLDSLTSIVDLNSHRRVPKFEMLNRLTVSGCNQLRFLLPLHVLEDLRQVESIDISECTKLEHVFADEQDTQMANSCVMEKTLPILHSLKLTNLPELASICSGNVQFISHSLTQMTVEDCPKFSFTFADSLRIMMEKEPSKENSKEMIVNPSKLNNLDLHDVDHLKNMCMNKDPLVIKFSQMKSLQLWNCSNIEYLFSLSMVKELSSLQKLMIVSCERIEQIVKREMEDREIIIVEFLQVETLILKQLPKFTGSSSKGDVSVKWLALATVKVDECTKIQKSMLGIVDRPLLKNVSVANCSPWGHEDREHNIGYLFDLTDELSKLENLKIEDSKQLRKYTEMVLQESSFMALKTVKASHCDNELNKLLSIFLERSNDLEQLRIESCELLEQVLDLTGFVVNEKQINVRFPKLNTMQLIRLRNLNCIWNMDPRGILGLDKLVKLEIIKCGLRKSSLTTAILEELVLLEELKIDSCEMMAQVVEDDLEIPKRSFLKLKVLQLSNLPRLTKFNSGHWSFRFPNLLSLTIEKCPRFNVLSNQMLTAEGTSDKVPQNQMMHTCPKLQTLKLVGLEMLEDIWKWIPLCDLKDVEVDSFTKLRHMWIAKSEKLEKLVVRNCNSLGRLVLPSNCFNMRELMISECNILEDICNDPKTKKMDEKTIHHLECIVLENLPKLSFFSLETCEFPSLRELGIVNCPTLVTLTKKISDKIDSSLSKHWALVLLFEDIKEDSQPGVGKMKIPPQLESLEFIGGLPSLQLWNRELKILMFEKLTLLKIVNCGGFENLFSISMAEHLSSLKLLTLYGCVDMVHVLQGGRGTGLRQVLVFKNLEILVLKHLPRLTSFCEEDVDFGELPKLEILRVEDIPKMNTFVTQPLRTPKLKQVHVTYISKCWHGNLNQTIKYLHENQEILKEEVWESDQSSTRHHSDTDESLSHQAIEGVEGDYIESSSITKISQRHQKSVAESKSHEIVDSRKQEIQKVLNITHTAEETKEIIQIPLAEAVTLIHTSVQGTDETFERPLVQNTQEGNSSPSIAQKTETLHSDIRNQETYKTPEKAFVPVVQNVPSSSMIDNIAINRSSLQAQEVVTSSIQDEALQNQEMFENSGERPLVESTEIALSSTTVYDAAVVTHRETYDQSKRRLSVQDAQDTGESDDPERSLENLSCQPTNPVMAENISANDPTPSNASSSSTTPVAADICSSFKELDISVQLLPYLEVGVKQHPQVLDWLNAKRRRVFASSSFSLFAEVTRILNATTQRCDFTEDDRNYIRECCTVLQGVGFDESWIRYVHGSIEERGYQIAKTSMKGRLRK